MRPAAAALLALALGLGQGCGSGSGERGPAAALRLVRDLPALARVRAEDLAVVAVPTGGLPPGSEPVELPAEAIGRAVRSRRPRGSLLYRGHLDPRSLAPEPVASRLAAGELGLAAPLAAGSAPPEGSWVSLPGLDIPLRVLALGPPGPAGRAAVLGGPRAAVLAYAAGSPRFPLEPVPAAPAPLPAPGPPPLPGPGACVFARRAVPAGQVLGPDDLGLTSLVAGLAPEAPVTGPAQAVGKAPMAALEPGEPLALATLAGPVSPGADAVLALDGLHPDWAHPGSEILLLRPGAGASPIRVRILDLPRQAPGASAAMRLAPAPGASWPKAQPGHEGGRRAWIVLLER